MKQVALSILALLILVSGAATYAQDEVNCDAPDYGAVEEALAQASAALNSGDMPAMFAAQAQAQALYRAIGNKCILEPVAQHFGLDEATVQALADAPSCQYLFDATVRTGPNTGANVHGTLSLLQNTDTGAVGYVFPDDGGALVPVAAQFGDNHAITLTFTLPDGATIVGTGTTVSSVATCYGAIVGSLTGPAEGDAGDWIGAPNIPIANCSMNPNLPCMLNPSKPPKPQQEPSGGICEKNYDPVCNLVCDANNANCHFECQDIVGATCGT